MTVYTVLSETASQLFDKSKSCDTPESALLFSSAADALESALLEVPIPVANTEVDFGGAI